MQSKMSIQPVMKTSIIFYCTVRKVRRKLTMENFKSLQNNKLSLQEKVQHSRSLVKSKQVKRIISAEKFRLHDDSLRSSYDELTGELYENKLKPGQWNTPFFSPKEKTSPQKKSIRTEMKHQKSLQYHVVYK